MCCGDFYAAPSISVKRWPTKSRFLIAVAEEVIKNMGHVYPELETNKKHILHVITLETDRFPQDTAGRTEGMLENIISKINSAAGTG